MTNQDFHSLFQPEPLQEPHFLNRAPYLPAIPPRSPLEVAASNIELDATRRGRVESALPRLEATLKTSASLRPLFKRFFTQGSYASRTAVRPLVDGDFDVDAMVVLDVRKMRLIEITPEHIVERLADALSANKWYADRLEMRMRCARIHYENGFHIDVVPAHSDDAFYSKDASPVYIPTASRAWEATHPLGFAEWFRVADQLSGRRLRLATLLMKRWRDLNMEESTRPPSILLTTLLAAFCPRTRASSLAHALAQTVADLNAALDGIVGVPHVPNPSLDSENLARDWSPAAYRSFRTQLAELSAAMDHSLQLRGPEQRAVWRELFGSAVPA